MSTTAITYGNSCANWTLNLSCCHCFWFHTGTIGIALLAVLNAFWSTFDALNFMSFKQTHNTHGASISHLVSSLIFVLFTVLLLVASIKLLGFSFWPFILYTIAAFFERHCTDRYYDYWADTKPQSNARTKLPQHDHWTSGWIRGRRLFGNRVLYLGCYSSSCETVGEVAINMISTSQQIVNRKNGNTNLVQQMRCNCF
ncbi:hypothetical protein M3Y94_00675500 [Aphelenchoides besseyi]|nr:hypothetical protein M3Y94_00675500 [Aphelenchoides besseyi]